jgi:prepilin-type N-terminal cleavage/methylation domain-containing protein
MFKKLNKNNKGFTLIELLVVIAIIGMLLSVIMVSFGQSRLRSRDAKRLSDMQQIRSGMDLYFNHGGGYPDPADWASGNLACSGTQIMEVPVDPVTGVPYVYGTQNATTGCGGTLYKEYYIQFATEGHTDIGDADTYYMSSTGFSTSAPF